MNRKFRLQPIKIIFRKPQKTTRRTFLKGAASFAGLVISPLSYARVIGNDDIPDNSQVIQDMTSKLLSTAKSINNKFVFECDSATGYLEGDINHDCTVNEEDFRIMARDWLSSDTSALGNVDCSYTYYPDSAGSIVSVDYRDFARLSRNWLQSSACGSI